MILVLGILCILKNNWATKRLSFIWIMPINIYCIRNSNESFKYALTYLKEH
jgi:hypothetical protein